MLVHDVLHDVQSDACAGLVVLRLEERIEDPLAVFLANPYAVIGHLDAEVRSVGLHLAGQSHIVLGVFVRIRQQVADDLRHRLPVDDGREVLVGIGYRKPFAALFEGGGEALADRLHQVVDILWG